MYIFLAIGIAKTINKQLKIYLFIILINMLPRCINIPKFHILYVAVEVAVASFQVPYQDLPGRMEEIHKK
jgi:hypothetical protein